MTTSMALSPTADLEPAAWDTLSPVPDGIQALLALFQHELGEIRFPALDAAVLAVAASKVREARLEVARCAAVLEAARAALRDAQGDLLTKGQRALAYARIYAEDHPQLRERLGSIELPSVPAPEQTSEAKASSPPARRRGRPPRSPAATLLFAGRNDADQEASMPIG